MNKKVGKKVDKLDRDFAFIRSRKVDKVLRRWIRRWIRWRGRWIRWIRRWIRWIRRWIMWVEISRRSDEHLASICCPFDGPFGGDLARTLEQPPRRNVTYVKIKHRAEDS